MFTAIYTAKASVITLEMTMIKDLTAQDLTLSSSAEWTVARRSTFHSSEIDIMVRLIIHR
jgi:hypothetical protein